jgi:beta-lactamase class A
MYELINGYGAPTAFMIVSLDDGMSIGYNVDKKFQTASSVKAPYALSVAREIAKGNADGKQLLTYKEKHFSIGTGVIKNSDFGTQFTVEQLIYYALHESDNVAHIMLHKAFGVKQYNQHMNNIGAGTLALAASNPWGFTNARSAALVWQDIYNFAIEDVEGINFLNILSNGKYNYFKEVMPGIPSASKTGFADYDVVETGIVFDEKPYICIVIANKGGNIGAYTQVLKMISEVNNIMNEYKEYSK